MTQRMQDGKAITRRFYDECWNRGNWRTLEEIVAENCITHDAVFPALAPGPANLRKHIENLRIAFPTFFLAVNRTIAEDDEVVVNWTGVGAHERQFLGLPPTYRNVTISGTSIFKIADCKIVEHWVDWNLMTLLQQLGFALPIQMRAASG